MSRLGDIDCAVGGPSMTKQSFRDEVNINSIISRFEKTGMAEHLNHGQPFYGDVSDIASYQDALNIVNHAEDLFMGMSAEIRARFQNNPVEMIKFLQDPSNLKEAVKLGMVIEAPVAPVAPVAPSDPVNP